MRLCDEGGGGCLIADGSHLTLEHLLLSLYQLTWCCHSHVILAHHRHVDTASRQTVGEVVWLVLRRVFVHVAELVLFVFEILIFVVADLAIRSWLVYAPVPAACVSNYTEARYKTLSNRGKLTARGYLISKMPYYNEGICMVALACGCAHV